MERLNSEFRTMTSIVDMLDRPEESFQFLRGLYTLVGLSPENGENTEEKFRLAHLILSSKPSWNWEEADLEDVFDGWVIDPDRIYLPGFFDECLEETILDVSDREKEVSLTEQPLKRKIVRNDSPRANKRRIFTRTFYCCCSRPLEMAYIAVNMNTGAVLFIGDCCYSKYDEYLSLYEPDPIDELTSAFEKISLDDGDFESPETLRSIVSACV